MRRRNSKWGYGAIAAGVVILLALVLPERVWWFLLAMALLLLGIWMIRSC